MQEINTGAIYEAKRAHKPDLTASNTVNIGLILLVAFAALLSDRIYHLA